MEDKNQQVNVEQLDETRIPKESVKRSFVGATSVKVLEMRPEEVTKTTMNKFCFRRVNQKIGIVYLVNKSGEAFEIEIDEATADAVSRCFKEPKKSRKQDTASEQEPQD